MLPMLEKRRTLAGVMSWIGLGILVLTMVLVRNENLIGVTCFGLICLIYEIHRAHTAGQKWTTGLLRVSVGWWNDGTDLERLVEALAEL